MPVLLGFILGVAVTILGVYQYDAQLAASRTVLRQRPRAAKRPW